MSGSLTEKREVAEKVRQRKASQLSINVDSMSQSGAQRSPGTSQCFSAGGGGGDDGSPSSQVKRVNSMRRQNSVISHNANAGASGMASPRTRGRRQKQMDSWEMQGEEAAAKALASTWIKRYPPTPDLRDTNGIKQSYKEDV